jgi:ribA/ribD-fused uncharacterized protein
MASTTTSYIYFWKPNQTNGYLSNWYNSPFIVDDKYFLNNEQYFMWRKQQLFDPQNILLETNILETSDPNKIKQLGRAVKNFNQTIWDENKYEIMKIGLTHKFIQNIDLKVELLRTKDAHIVEASPFDKIWGIGLNEQDARYKEWRGENLLGKALMDVRQTLN